VGVNWYVLTRERQQRLIGVAFAYLFGLPYLVSPEAKAADIRTLIVSSDFPGRHTGSRIRPGGHCPGTYLQRMGAPG
jgi:hypothetical protein